MIRQRINFFGNVQGVGFRYTACSIVHGFDISGYVCNRSNGSVELVAEGKREEIERFLVLLRDRMSGHIDREETAEQPATGEFDGFRIR